MSNNLYVTGLWRAVDAMTTGDNPGFQFNGFENPDAYGRGYELNMGTLDAIAQSVSWMIDPATGLPHDYAKPNIMALLTAFAKIGLSGADLVTASNANDMIVVEGGNDTVYAGRGDDYIDGGPGNDTIYGQEGNDIIKGGPGEDFINGGAGIDTAIYSGLRHHYGIEGDMAWRIVASPEDGQDTLVDVERLQFADGTLTFDDAHSTGVFTLDETAAQVARLYRAAIDRLPDGPGLLYWLDIVKSGKQTIGEVADRFVASPEFTATYGSLSDKAYVERIYENVLDRTPTDKEVSYWTGYLANGAHDRGDVLQYFSDSAEFRSIIGGTNDTGIVFL